MEENDFRKKMITRRDDLVEDLLDWALKLKAIGGLVSALAWYEKNYDKSAHLVEHGEDLGNIINDYAEFIETALNDNIGEIRSIPESIEKLRAAGKI